MAEATEQQQPSSDGAAAAEAAARVPWEEERDSFRDSPELFVGAAFAGGFILARLLRRLGG